MAVNPRTIARLEARIRERAAYCIEFELNDPRANFITLTRVELARDLSGARILYSVLGNQADKSKARNMLEDASGFIQRQVARVLRTRKVPRLSWVYDDSVEFAAEMDQKIKQALRQDKAINPDAHAGDPAAQELTPEELAELDDKELLDVEYDEFVAEQDEDGEVRGDAD